MPRDHGPLERRRRLSDASAVSAERHGTVFIAEDIARPGTFFGSWEAEPDAPPAMLEQMPDTRDLDEAIAWGHRRAEVVLVRVTTRDHHSAGDRLPANVTLPVWPPTSDELAAIAAERAALAARPEALA